MDGKPRSREHRRRGSLAARGPAAAGPARAQANSARATASSARASASRARASASSARAAAPRAHTAAVLAGGAGRRMGGTKAAARFGDASLLAHATDLARRAGLRPVVVARSDSTLAADHGAEVLIEPPGPRHPLWGIAAALDELRAPLVVLACDMPLVPPPLVARLAALDGSAVAVVPETAGGIEPLCARYEPAASARLREAAQRGLAARVAIAALGARRIGAAELAAFGDPERLLASANTPADLEAAERALAERRRRGHR